MTQDWWDLADLTDGAFDALVDRGLSRCSLHGIFLPPKWSELEFAESTPPAAVQVKQLILRAAGRQFRCQRFVVEALEEAEKDWEGALQHWQRLEDDFRREMKRVFLSAEGRGYPPVCTAP